MFRVIGLIRKNNKEIPFDYTVDTDKLFTAINSANAALDKKYKKHLNLRMIAKKVENGEANIETVEEDDNRI